MRLLNDEGVEDVRLSIRFSGAGDDGSIKEFSERLHHFDPGRRGLTSQLSLI